MESFIVTHSSATGQYSMRKQYLCIHYKTLIIATLDTKLGTLGKIRPVSNTFSLHSIQTASDLLQLHVDRTYFPQDSKVHILSNFTDIKCFQSRFGQNKLFGHK